MYDEADYIMLSALQHYQFCPRQCALIHIEQQWSENRFTAEGKVLHERADSGQAHHQGGVRVVRTLPLCSRQLGLSGQADVVEFHPDGRIYPVEYKRGKPKKDRCDEVQLCAQALCLEEMLKVRIDSGALFYGQQRRRKEVLLDAALRELTQAVIDNTHQLIQSCKTPSAKYDKKCDACSMFGLCLPQSCASGRSVSRYLNRMLGGEGEP
jgi:CRISPR-associated exonuclease Cas4